MMLLDQRHASLLVVDVQERLLPAMQEPERVLARTGILLRAAAELALPVTISEQYPKGLGRTVAELAGNAAVTFEKLSFSCWRDEAMKAHFIKLHEQGRVQVVVAGIEAHVCVLQTCLDMAQAGFAVYAVADAMSSRQPQSMDLAFARMRQNDIQLINTEMAVFELMGKAGTPMFKVLSGLIR